ncbi:MULTISPECIES: hypothetical protein [Nostoc]|uniref:Uncharacterized protein n=2 Tax=Nostoc TaxID=1177 RepID=A0ABR8IGX3_9NOSO|nr:MULTISPECIES: hypothetical protein [Nostoc]MBD2563969.1 hypothetical protein [Nostoc linckia FACHB-391]MBD2650443.1 hypothetical protein [Nostoc foliaceum FACHB-393]
MQFSILFTVAILHNYYSEASQGSQDFSFMIPADTAQLLRNGKLITKICDRKLYVLFEADEANAPVASIVSETLRFGLKLQNPFFANFTDLDFDISSYTPLYSNSTNLNQLDVVKEISLVGHVFSHSLTNDTRPVMVTLKNTNNQVLQTDTINATNNRSTVTYNLTGQAPGLYSIEKSYPNNLETSLYYSNAELQQQGIFSLIEIKIDSNFYTSNTPEFAINFNPKTETLKYYLVVPKEAEVDQLSVLDNGFTEDGRSAVIFKKELLAEIPVLLSNANTSVVLFKSETIKRQEKARRKIQLQKNGDVLIGHLPQPSAEKANAEIIIQLAKL